MHALHARTGNVCVRSLVADIFILFSVENIFRLNREKSGDHNDIYIMALKGIVVEIVIEKLIRLAVAVIRNAAAMNK